jgi:hypothetical protein
MKKIIALASLFTLIGCAFLNISAQEKMIEKELAVLRKNSSEKLKSESYRVKMTIETYQSIRDSKPYFVITETGEYVPPNDYHSISEKKSSKGITRTETIKIGQKKYTRLNDGNWIQTAAENGLGFDSRSTVVTNSERTVKYDYKGKKVVNNQSSDLYEIKTITRDKFNGFEYQNVVTQRFLFNQDGLLLRTEFETKDNNKRFNTRIIQEYEYDPNLKIEAPFK